MKFRLLFSASFIMLGACTTTTSETGQSQLSEKEYINLACQQPEMAIKALENKNNFISPKERLIYAVALHNLARLGAAHIQYELLKNSNSQDYISITCQPESPIAGTVSDIATKQLEMMQAINKAPNQPNIVEKVSSTQKPSDHITENTESSSKPSQENAKKSADSHTIAKPESLDPFGDWFLHLTSYLSETLAQNGMETLGGIYPTLAGSFDSWQTTAGDKEIWRVGLRLNSRDEGRELCRQIQAAGQYCVLLRGHR